MIADTLVDVLVVTSALSVVLALALFGIKVAHRRRLVKQERRRDVYVAILGDLVSGTRMSSPPPAEWSVDPVFLDVLFEYVSVLTGSGRKILYELIGQLEIRTNLTRQVRTARRTERRLRALTYLVEIADQGQRALFHECLSDPVAEVRLHAARGLAVISDVESVPRLLEALHSETPWNTGRLADILVGFGPAAVPALTQYLADSFADCSPSPDAVREVIRAVGLIGALEAEDVLLDLLTSDESIYRVGAASALADCGTPRSVPALVVALDDPDWRVRARAADALAMFSDPRAVEPLARKLRDTAWWVRQNAAEALGEIPGGIDRLAEALNDDDPFCRDAARYQLGRKRVIRAARHRLESGVGSTLDRRILAASQTTIEELLEEPAVPGAHRRAMVGDGVVDRFKAFAAESTFELVERLRRLRRHLASDSRRFPSLKDVGGGGPYQPGGAGGGGFRATGGQFTTRARLAREEARVRAALEDELMSLEQESEV